MEASFGPRHVPAAGPQSELAPATSGTRGNGIPQLTNPRRLDRQAGQVGLLLGPTRSGPPSAERRSPNDAVPLHSITKKVFAENYTEICEIM